LSWVFMVHVRDKVVGNIAFSLPLPAQKVATKGYINHLALLTLRQALQPLAQSLSNASHKRHNAKVQTPVHLWCWKAVLQQGVHEP
jgi:hypothetical protein